MKRLTFILIFGLFSSQIFAGNDKKFPGEIKTEVKTDTSAKDTVEYELLVFDPEFETFLLMQPPMEFYSESYYKTWNSRYVMEWNYRYIAMPRSNLYESYIEYNEQTDYGIKLEYQLYYFFRCFETQNHIALVQRGR